MLRRAERQVPVRVYEVLGSRPVVGLLYHGASEEPLPHVRHLYAHKHPDEVRADVRYLSSLGDRVVGYDRLREIAEGAVSDGAVVFVTTDDGMASVFDTVSPLLVEHGIPCTHFVTTGVLDNAALMWRHAASLCVERAHAADPYDDVRSRLEDSIGVAPSSADGFASWVLGLTHRDTDALAAAQDAVGLDVDAFLRHEQPYLTTSQVRRLAEDGCAIGAHGVSHLRASTLTIDELEDEIVESCDVVRSITGADRVPFAFPFTADGASFDDVDAIRRRHPEIDLTFGTGGSRPSERRYHLNRVGVDRPSRTPGQSALPDLFRRIVRGSR